ncbi:MAG: glycosyltransferase family 4 protein [Candidatus Woesearchaeota archaeon]|nr:glycosyltransferase family 4 protein [candidate division KSB1 bacterium]
MKNKLYPNLGIIIPADIKRQFPQGGALTFVLNFAELYQGEIIIFDATLKRKELFASRKIKFNNVSLERIPIIRIINNKYIPIRLQSLLFYILSISKLYNLAKKIDAFYVHSPEAALPLVIFKYKKVIYHMHGATNPLLYSKFRFFRKKIFQKLFDIFIHFPIIKRSDLIITINEECQNLVNLVYKNTRSFYLPNLVNRNMFKKLEKAKCRELLGLKKDETIILYVGRLSEVKGLYFLLDVFYHLQSSHSSDLKLIFVGTGEEESNLKSKCKQLGITNCVEFHGKVNYEKMPIYYNSSDLFILPSYREGTPMVLLEAMSCGAKILTSTAGNTEKLLKNYPLKIVLKNHCLEEWKDAIIKLLNIEIKNNFSVKEDVFFSNFINELKKLRL